jgi:hypothetical protein
VYGVNDKQLTSVDFLTTVTPSILDMKASMNMGLNTVKMMLWYDNEWSYSAQCLRVMSSMFEVNLAKKTQVFKLAPELGLRALDFDNKKVRALRPAYILCRASARGGEGATQKNWSGRTPVPLLDEPRAPDAEGQERAHSRTVAGLRSGAGPTSYSCWAA